MPLAGLDSWLKENLRSGLIVPVHHGRGALEWFQLGEVTGVDREKGRFYVKDNGVFFFSGRNCSEPKGPVYIVLPTPEVMSAAREGVQTLNGNASCCPRRRLSTYEVELATRLAASPATSSHRRQES